MRCGKGSGSAICGGLSVCDPSELGFISSFYKDLRMSKVVSGSWVCDRPRAEKNGPSISSLSLLNTLLSTGSDCELKVHGELYRKVRSLQVLCAQVKGDTDVDGEACMLCAQSPDVSFMVDIVDMIVGLIWDFPVAAFFCLVRLHFGLSGVPRDDIVFYMSECPSAYPLSTILLTPRVDIVRL